MFKKSIIAAVAAVTIAASMASPAQALSKRGALALGLGLGTVAAIGIANAHDRDRHYGNNHYYAGSGYGGGYGYGSGYGYREGRAYRRAFRKCDYRFGEGSWRFDRCMARRGF